MGSFDIPPEHAPVWLIPITTVLLGIGAFCWDVVYLLTIREIRYTGICAIPTIPLALNVAWEFVYLVISAMEFAILESIGLSVWLLLDLAVVWIACRHSNTFCRMGLFLVLALTAHAMAAWWWLQAPGRGCGDKTGKTWRGLDGYDTTELAFWSATVCQFMGSWGCWMLLQNGYASSQAIWAFRLCGSIAGLGFANGLLWWYWPEAHSYFVHPLAILFNMESLLYDLAYGYRLQHLKKAVW